MLHLDGFESIGQQKRTPSEVCGMDDIGLENIKESPGPYPAKNSPPDCFIEMGSSPISQSQTK